jgi:circadian clock protein KaiC
MMRAKTLGLPLEEGLEYGVVNVQQIDPTEMAPGAYELGSS